MDFQFYFRKMDSSESLKSLAERKLSDRLQKHVGIPEKIHLTFYLDGSQHYIHCSLTTAHGQKIFAEASSETMYAAIDILCSKVEAQLKRQKSKQRAKERRTHWPTPVYYSNPSHFHLDDSIDAADVIKLEAAIRPFRERYLH